MTSLDDDVTDLGRTKHVDARMRWPNSRDQQCAWYPMAST